jgi:hypothetical protein
MRTGLPATVLALGLSVALCQAQPNTLRIEENNPGIVYSSTTIADTAGTHSAGRAIVMDQTASRAFLTFTGTGISWIGDTGFNRGVARVYLDGNLNTVDTYSDNRDEQKALFVAKGLPEGVHTLVIEVAPMKNVNATGTGISIDAFDIQKGTVVSGAVATPGFYEQNSSVVTFSGTWYLNQSPRASNSSAVLAMESDAKATVVFNGTGILWIGYRDPWAGYARVLIDGVQKGLIDTWDWAWGDGGVDEQWQRPIWQIQDLPAGNHTLTIEVLGQRNGSSGGNWVWIDSFKVTGPTAKP